ncbi:hypothetical protein VMCG_02979 [Cytospora schulzeri]|uniref:Uncharacterized protein n=1 Tax=Cytospora schulzeri TaxID=448051 RepID=A0A423WZ05_9PEZI|nr:hypothetical protein VMCG_02979 [Valsa malicola]
MDNQIRSFMRVIRRLDNADELIQRFPEWERSALSQDAASSSLTPQDQRRILNFPDVETQAANIANSSTLGKEDLLKRAAETPTQLSATEVSLLKNRYWLDISPDEEHEVCLASGLIMGPHRVSEEDYEEAGKRLKAVRQPFYAENEEKAIENALVEHWRRGTDAWRARQKQEAERSLPMSFPWVRRLWEEDKGEKHWGYGIFVDPEAFVDDEESGSYLIRQDGVLFHARGAIGAGSSAINNMWQLQTLDWPTSATADGGEKEGGSQAIQQSDSKEDSNNPAADEVCREKEGIEQENDEKRAAKFENLRQHFKSIRDRAPKRQRREQAASSETTQAESGGLEAGILQNVFLVVDKCSAGSVLSGPGLVDDMWVWAVDPDYDDANDASATAATTEGSTSTETPSNYRGFMRVRLQQTVNKFYDARRFHGDDYPMTRLWEAAQKSKHHAFVSPKDDEARSWSMDRFVGSLMRAQPPRIVYGPKPVVPAGTGAS